MSQARPSREDVIFHTRSGLQDYKVLATMCHLWDEFDGCASTSMSEDSLSVHNVLLLCHLHLVRWQMGGVAFDVI